MFPGHSSDKFQQIALIFATLYLFYPFFFLVSLYKIPFKKPYCLCYLFESVSERESCGTYCLNLQLNTKLGFSVILFKLNFTLNSLHCIFYSLSLILFIFHCHRSQVYSDSKWLYLIGSYLWIKYNCLTFKLCANK